MIEKMTKYSFILLSGNQEEFIHKLEELGLMDISRSTKVIDEESKVLLDKSIEYKQSLSKLEAISFPVQVSQAVADEQKNLSNDQKIESFHKHLEELNELRQSLEQAEKDEVDERIWGELDSKTLEAIKKQGYKFYFYSANKNKFKEEWKEKYNLEILNETTGTLYFVIISNDPDYSFELNTIQGPTKDLKELAQEIQSLKEKISECQAYLEGLKRFIPELKQEEAAYIHQLDIYLANKAAQKEAEDHISTFIGFAPTDNREEVEKTLDSLPVFYIAEKAVVEDNPPIKLRNNRFTRLFRILTDMYGRPVYNEFDPTPYLSIFFLLFFAMCMGDVGYGLVLFFIGLYLNKKKEDMKDIGALVSVLGVATMIVGFVMHTAFGVDVAGLSWMPSEAKKFMITEKIANYDPAMILSLIVGIIHLCLAMIVKTIYACKNKGFFNCVGIWSWTTLIVSTVIIGVLYALKVVPSGILKIAIIVIGIVCAIGIYLLNDPKRNPLINIGAGLWETYNTATGLLGDVLSYLRLYALGLAGAMLAQAFNQLAWSTMGGSFGLKFGLIGFILILLFGHSLNIAMCCLGAFVHPLRLNFLEFFKNSDYQGRGRNYKPIKKLNNIEVIK